MHAPLACERAHLTLDTAQFHEHDREQQIKHTVLTRKLAQTRPRDKRCARSAAACMLFTGVRLAW